MRIQGWKHTYAVNETALSIGEGLENYDWECWTHEESFPLGSGRDILIPAAVVEYEDPNGVVQTKFLEIDLGNEPIRTLADKIWNYHRYFSNTSKCSAGDPRPTRQWEERFPFGFPDVVLVWSQIEPTVAWKRTISLAEQIKKDRRYEGTEFRVLAGLLSVLKEGGPLKPTLIDLQSEEWVSWMDPPTTDEYEPKGLEALGPPPANAETVDIDPPLVQILEGGELRGIYICAMLPRMSLSNHYVEPIWVTSSLLGYALGQDSGIDMMDTKLEDISKILVIDGKDVRATNATVATTLKGNRLAVMVEDHSDRSIAETMFGDLSKPGPRSALLPSLKAAVGQLA